MEKGNELTWDERHPSNYEIKMVDTDYLFEPKNDEPKPDESRLKVEIAEILRGEVCQRLEIEHYDRPPDCTKACEANGATHCSIMREASNRICQLLNQGCQQRAERVFEEIEKSLRLQDKAGFYWIYTENWQALKKEEGLG